MDKCPTCGHFEGLHATDKCELLAENKRLRELLTRAKETFEPFPTVSDLRSLHRCLRENKKIDETEKANIEKMYRDHEEKDRQLYREICQALKEQNGKGS